MTHVRILFPIVMLGIAFPAAAQKSAAGNALASRPAAAQQNRTRSVSAPEQQRPNFTGTWQLAVGRTAAEAGSDPPSEATLRIAHTGDRLRVVEEGTFPSRGKFATDLSFVMDGVERPSDANPEWRGTTNWDGTSVTKAYRNKNGDSQQVTYNLEAGGRVLHIVEVLKVAPSINRRSEYFYDRVSDVWLQE